MQSQHLKCGLVATTVFLAVAVLGASQVGGAVWLSVSVHDREGRPVRGLEQADFSVRVAGAPQPLTYFSAKPAPFAAVLLLDESESVRGLRPFIYKAAAQFVSHFRRGDRLTLATFAQATFVGGFTANRAALDGSLAGISRQQRIAGGAPCRAPASLVESTRVVDLSSDMDARRRRVPRNGTALWDALECAANALNTDAEAVKRLVVVITDGEDTSSYGTEQTAAASIRRAGASVWAAGIADDTPSARSLQAIAEESGGRYLVLRREGDLATAFHVLNEEVRSQYLLGFKPRVGTSTGTVDVSVTRPELTVRTRRTF